MNHLADQASGSLKDVPGPASRLNKRIAISTPDERLLAQMMLVGC